MTEKTPVSKKRFSADWLLRGVLTKIGDSFDALTGRRWVPSSSLAASELIDRIKKLLDAEAVEVEGKGTVVPHHITLKMQWNKFSEDAQDAIKKLETELLTAAVDHINDSLYYTHAPVSLEVKPDYFVEGVKLYVSFDKFTADETDVELNVTIPSINISRPLPAIVTGSPPGGEIYIARFKIDGEQREQTLDFPSGVRLSVGRTANDLILDDPSVSKIHASLATADGGSLAVADTGSTNGTFINGQRISYGKAIRLEGGDVIRFGQVEVRFEHRPKAAEPGPGTPVVSPGDEAVRIDDLEFRGRETLAPTLAATLEPAVTEPEISRDEHTTLEGPDLDATTETESVGGESDERTK